MPAEDYKALVLGNPKTESWINWQLSGREAFKEQMRSLARQAVIFMLVTPLVFVASRFSFLHHQSSVSDPYAEFGGATINVRGLPPGVTLDSRPHDAPASDAIQAPPRFVPVPPGAVLVPIQSASVSSLDSLVSALWFGLFGFRAGLALWLFYRAVFFVVKG